VCTLSNIWSVHCGQVEPRPRTAYHFWNNCSADRWWDMRLLKAATFSASLISTNCSLMFYVAIVSSLER
jgi:hypothetical protein